MTDDLEIERHGSTTSSFVVYNSRLSPLSSLAVDVVVLALLVTCLIPAWPASLIVPDTSHPPQWQRWTAILVTVLYIKFRTSSVLQESILVTRGLGVQLCTTRGIVLPFKQTTATTRPHSNVEDEDDLATMTRTRYKTIPLSHSRSFLSMSSISDVVINEAIWRWQIIYYLLIVVDEARVPLATTMTDEGVNLSSKLQRDVTAATTQTAMPIKLKIAFPELLPRLAVVKRVWTGVRHSLYDELDEHELQESERDVL
ncbi:hypothetical protein ACM66B_006279 [Microbotryomycetes sp. NB124-2]